MNKTCDDYVIDKKELNVIIGRNMREYRIRSQYHLEEVAKMAGYSSGYVALVERGIRMGSLPFLLKICNVFNVSIDKLIHDTSVENMEDITFSKFKNIYNMLDEKDRNIVLELVTAFYEGLNKHSDSMR